MIFKSNWLNLNMVAKHKTTTSKFPFTQAIRKNNLNFYQKKKTFLRMNNKECIKAISLDRKRQILK